MTQQTPPGWYPDPGDPDRSRWWSGTAWTGLTALPSAVPQMAATQRAARPQLGRGWFLLTRVLQCALLMMIGVDVWAITNNLHVAGFLEAWLADPASVNPSEALALDRRSAVVTAAYRVSLLASFPLLMAWVYRTHRSRHLDRTYMAHKSGWAIGGWFVPILALWRPLQMVQDIQRGATGRPDRSWLAVAWWCTWLFSLLLRQVSAAFAGTRSDWIHYEIEGAIGAANMAAIAEGFDIVATVLILALIHQFAGRVWRRRSPGITDTAQ